MTINRESPNAAHEQALARREAELRAMLHSSLLPATAVAESEVTDFKDLAALDAQSDIDEARVSQANRALAEVLAARSRLDEGVYGVCQDCGAAVDPARLAALPEAAYCTYCQSTHEHAAQRHAQVS